MSFVSPMVLSNKLMLWIFPWYVSNSMLWVPYIASATYSSQDMFVRVIQEIFEWNFWLKIFICDTGYKHKLFSIN